MPSTSSPSGPDRGGSSLRRWGPAVAIVAVLALIAGVVLLGGSDDDDAGAPGTTVATGEEPAAAGGAVSFSQAQEEGLDVSFPDSCDTDTGRVAIPYYFAAECYADVEDNGGATDEGVRGDTIKVVVYLSPDNDPILDFILGSIQNDDTSADVRATYEGYAALFQAMYQTYGRTVELQFLNGSGNATDEEAGRADAIRAAEEMGAFAVWGGPTLNPGWTDELRARNVVCLSCFSVPDMQPTAFSLVASADQVRVHLTEYIIKRLAGRPAVHAGDEAFRSRPRVFGHLWIEASANSAENAQEQRDALAAEGVDIVESIPFDITRAGEQAPGIITRFKEAGVTSLIIQGDPSTPAIFTSAATAQEWFPEWIIGGSALMDTTAFARSYDQAQWAHAFGISSLAARTEPGVGDSVALYEWFHGEPPAADETSGVLLPQPSVFFGALQIAGPDLTTESFVDAVYQLGPFGDAVTLPGFSYGDHGIYPMLEGPDHNGIDDFTEIWYDPTVAGIDEISHDGVGAYQYVDGGRRYVPGEWTDDDRAFDPEGAVAVYEEAPEAEQVRDYPRPG